MSRSFIRTTIFEAVDNDDIALIERELCQLVPEISNLSGCICFRIHQDIENPSRFIMWAEYSNIDGYHAFLNNATYRSVIEKIETKVVDAYYAEPIC